MAQLCWLWADKQGTEKAWPGGHKAALRKVPGTGPRQGV